jgi:hypothetical protein
MHTRPQILGYGERIRRTNFRAWHIGTHHARRHIHFNDRCPRPEPLIRAKRADGAHRTRRLALATSRARRKKGDLRQRAGRPHELARRVLLLHHLCRFPEHLPEPERKKGATVQRIVTHAAEICLPDSKKIRPLLGAALSCATHVTNPTSHPPSGSAASRDACAPIRPSRYRRTSRSRRRECARRPQRAARLPS